jgi:DNA-binding transcriptional MerR regulator
MENANSFGYFSKDVALHLEITTSTLRRWSIELEKTGYMFERNEKEQRIYYERDYKAFRELKKLLATSVSFTDAINAIAAMNLNNKNAQKTPNVYDEYIRLSKRELQDLIQKAVQQAITNERDLLLEKMEQKINDTLEQRDLILVNTIKISLEQRQLEMAAAKEEKVPFLKKLFRRHTK